MTRLGDLAAVVRSKNAGPFLVTLDVFFDDVETFERVRACGALEPESVARAYGLDPNAVSGPYWEHRALGGKVSFVKPIPAGQPGCTDVFGSHQHAPLADMDVP